MGLPWTTSVLDHLSWIIRGHAPVRADGVAPFSCSRDGHVSSHECRMAPRKAPVQTTQVPPAIGTASTVTAHVTATTLALRCGRYFNAREIVQTAPCPMRSEVSIDGRF